METIKISVEVSVNLSENTQKFLTSLFAIGVPSGAQVAASVSKPAPAALEEPAPAKPTPQPAAPAVKSARSLTVCRLTCWLRIPRTAPRLKRSGVCLKAR